MALGLPPIPVDSGLSRYFREIWRFPILEPEQEYMLAKRWREHHDTDAAQQLVTSHLRLVAKIAMKYRGYGLPVSDLVAEGNIGLMKAVHKFEPDLGYRVSTYAIWWIKAAITEYILRSWSLVKVGTVAAQKKLFFSLRRVKGQLKIMGSGELAPESTKLLAERLNVSERDVSDMNARLSARDASLNAPVSNEEGGMEFQETLVDTAPTPEAVTADRQELEHRQSLLKRALTTLPDRERRILIERRLKDEPATLEELGQEYGISRERVRQLEVRAFQRLQQEMAQAAG